jgi:Tol biopolymer transport system component
MVAVAAVAVVLAGGFASAVARSSGVVFPGGQGLIAFNRQVGNQTDIAVVRPDRTGFKVLIPNASDPAWSPDGRLIAFSRRSSRGDMDVWIANADGTGQRELTSPGTNESKPDWSPDGKQLVFVGSIPGARLDDLFVENVDGSGRRQLTRDDHYDGVSPEL